MPATSTDQARRDAPRRSTAPLALALVVATAVAIPAPATARGPIAESFRQWSQRRQTRTRVEKPFSHQSTKVDLSARPSTWSKIQSSGMATAARAAGQGGRSSLVGKLRDRLGKGSDAAKSGFQQTTKPILHDEQGMLSR